jgi:hypothetical protein
MAFKSFSLMRFTVITIIIFLLSILANTRGALAADSPEQFLNAYQACQAGEKMEREGIVKEALKEYWKAESLLVQIRKNDPSWQRAVIEYRLKLIRDDLRRLQPDANFSEDVTAPVVPSSDLPTGTPVLEILSARLEGEGQEPKKLQVTIKPNPKATIEVPHVRVQVFFYDNDKGKIVQSKAQVTSKWLSAPVDWGNGENELLEIRLQPDTSGSASKFAGYVIAVYYKGDLQDCHSDPPELKKLFPLKYFISFDDPSIIEQKIPPNRPPLIKQQIQIPPDHRFLIEQQIRLHRPPLIKQQMPPDRRPLNIEFIDTNTTKAVQALDQAKKSILVQSYAMSFNSVGRALLNAKKRGVDVKVILDNPNKSECFNQAPSLLATAGIPTYIDTTGKLSLPTVMVLDGDTVIEGYFSFPKKGENSTDNFAVYSHVPEMVAISTTNWFTKLEHSENYVPEKHIIGR